MADKAVVWITHQLDLLPSCDLVAIVEGGVFQYFGPYDPTVVDPMGETEQEVRAACQRAVAVVKRTQTAVCLSCASLQCISLQPTCAFGSVPVRHCSCACLCCVVPFVCLFVHARVHMSVLAQRVAVQRPRAHAWCDALYTSVNWFDAEVRMVVLEGHGMA